MELDGLFFKVGAQFDEVFTSLDTALASMETKVASFGAAMTTAITDPLKAAFGPKVSDILGKAFDDLTGNFKTLFGTAFEGAVTLDNAFDSIRVKTGQTGEALNGLKNDFRAVFQDVPDSADKVAQALGMIADRTGLTGPPLQQLTQQFLDLSRITGEALGPAMDKITRLFGDWSIDVSKQAGTMDMLLRASQMAGVGVTDLSSKLVQYGAPLRQLGIDFESSTAMIAKFTKEGVNVETVLGAMKTAMAKLASAGKDPVQGFQNLIIAIKDADVATGNLIAKNATNARSFGDFAAAVREGRFEFDGFKKSIVEGGDSIKKAVADTEDFAEAWKKFKNQITIALEPLGTILFQAVNDATEKMKPLIDIAKEIGAAFMALPKDMQNFIVEAGVAAAAIGPLALAASQLPAILGALSAGFVTLLPVLAAAAGAFIGWKLGTWLYDNSILVTKFGNVLAELALKLPIIGDIVQRLSGITSAEEGLGRANAALNTGMARLEATLKAHGVAIDKTKMSTDQYVVAVNKAALEIAKTELAHKKAGDAAADAGKAVADAAEKQRRASITAQLAAESQAKAHEKAAAAAKKFAEEVTRALKSVDDLTENMPRSFAQFQDAVEKGFNVNSAVKQVQERINDLKREFGEKLPASVKGAVVALTLVKDRLVEFAAEATQAKLDDAFEKLNYTLTHTKQIADTTSPSFKNLMNIVMSDAIASGKAIHDFDEAAKHLGVTFSETLVEAARKADLAYTEVNKKFDEGTASALDLAKASESLLQKQIAAGVALGQNVDQLRERAKLVNDQINGMMKGFKDQAHELGVTLSGEVLEKMHAAEDAFKAIVKAQGEGKANAIDVQQIYVKMLESQIAAGQALGQNTVNLQKSAEKAKEALVNLQTGMTPLQRAWEQFGGQVHEVFITFYTDLAGVLLQANSFSDAWHKAINSVRDAFLNTLIKGAIREVSKALEDLDGEFGNVAKTAASFFGMGGSTSGGGGGGKTPSIPTSVPGQTPNPTSVISQAGNSITGMINVVTGAISAITGILSFLGQRHMEADIGKIEVTIRGVLNQLISIQGTLNQYLPNLINTQQLIRLEGIENLLTKIGDTRMLEQLSRLQGIENASIQIANESDAMLLSSLIGGTIADAMGYVVKFMSDALVTLFTQFSTEISTLRQNTWNQLSSVILILTTLYNTMSKPGWQPATNLPTNPTSTGNNPSIPGGGNNTSTQGATSNRPIQVVVQSKSSNPYTQGLVAGQALNAVTGGRY